MIQKNRSSDIIALINNWSQVENATTSAINAEGSAMQEYSIHMDTIPASLNTLSSTWQDFSNIFLNSKFLKGGVDTLSTLLDLFGKLIDKVGLLPTLLTGLSAFGTSKNIGFFKLIDDDATKSGKRMVNIFSDAMDSILLLNTKMSTSFNFGTDFSNNLNNDIACLNNFINAVAQGESQGVAFSNYMLNASANAQQYAQSMEVSSLSVAQFELAQKQSEISLMASNKSMTSTKLLIDEFQGGLKNCGLSQQQFLASIQATNPQLATYLSGLNGANASLKGYIRNLITTKVATVTLQMATMALNTAITMGLSVVITGLISKIQELYVSEEEAIEQAQENLQTTQESIDKYNEERNSLDELIKKYKELKNSGDNSPETRSEIAEVQKEIVSLVGAEATELDLVGGKLDDNLAKLKKYKKQLLEKESSSLLDKYKQSRELNANPKDTAKLWWLGDKYDITGDIGASAKYLKQIGVEFSQNPFNNKIGLDAELNEFDNHKEIESAKEALDYYKKIKEEWIKAYSDDKGVNTSYAERMLSNTNEVFSKLDAQITDLEKKANEERQIAQSYIDNQFLKLSEFDNDLNKVKVNSVDDYQKYVDIFTNKILNDVDIKKFIEDGYFSEEDVKNSIETYIAGLDQIGAYTDNWKRKYKNIETNVTFSQEGLDKAKENFDAFYKSIEESMSDTGLSSETINNIQAIYGELDGYDASKLFERTAIGIRLNRTELEKLQKQYDYQNKSAIHSNLRDLVIEYEDLENELNRCTTAKEREKIQSQMDSKQNEIDEVRQLASEYDALTSKHYEWLKALSTPNEGDNYDSFVSNLDKVKELYNKGLIGTDDFQKSVQMMTYEDLSGKTAEEYVKVYQDKLPTIKKFFKEGTSGCENFLKAIQNLNKDWAKQNKDGSWELNFESDKLAKEMGISVDLVEYFIGKLKDFGFTYENEVENLSLDKLAKDANKFLNEEKETKIKFNFDTKNIKDANAEIEKAQKLLDSYKNEDGVLDLRVKGASESQTILTALIKNRQKLSQPAIMDIKLNKDELETDYGHTVTLLQNLQKYADTLEVKIKTGQDTSDTKTKIQDTIKELNNLPEEVKTSIGFNEEEVKKKLSNIANVEADVELNENDIDTIRKTIASVEPEVLAKVDKTEIKKFKKDNIDKKADVLFDLKKTKVLKDFLDSTPVVEGEVRFTTTTPPKTNKSNDEKPSPSRSNPVKNDKKKGKSGADGTATSLASGTAFANGKSGNWSIGTSGKALVGEQGEELRVRNGKWELIGSDSAEFVDVQPNDIIFNNEQVKQLFKYGKIINGKSRGRSLASGTAFSDGTSSGNAFAEGLNNLKGKIISGGTTKKKTNSKSKSSSKSKSKSSSSKSDEAKETFDWIEIAIERIENAISDLDKIADSVYYNFSTRNSKLKKEYSEVKKEISLQEKAYTRYMKQANSVGLSSSYKKLVQNGKIDISTIKDDKLKEKINSYKEWYDKAQNVKDAIADLKLEMKNLRKEMFDLTATDYDNFVGRLEKQKTLIDNYISRSESKGLTISTKYYDALINIENNSLTKLKSERTALIKALNNAVKSGDVAVYSDAWYEMQGKIDDVNESIQMCTNNLIEFQNEIRQIKWDNFDYLHETISQITDESDFLVSLFENKDLFDDKGNITNIGTSTLGLYGMDYNVLMQQAQSYAREIESLNKEIAKTPNDKNLIARRNELIKSQQDMILNAMSEKKAMIDLVRDGYDLQLDSLQDLIDKYNEALESERDLYDYQKKVKDQTKEVANLEKQLSAYANDTSEETKAKVQQLKVSLEEAKDNLKETEYDRYIQNQKDLLENIYKEYEDIINSKFDDVDVLFSELISNVNSNSTTINDTLISESEKVGYNLTDSIESIWGDSGTVLSDFSNGFNEFSGKFDTYVQNGTNNIESWLGTINSNLITMINNGNVTATNEVNKATTTKYTAKGTTTSSSSSSSSSKSKTSSSSSKSKTTTSSKSKTAGYISSLKPLITSSSSSSYIKKVQTALKALGFKGKNGKSLTIDGIWGTNTDYAVKSFQKSSKYGGSITADGKIGKNTKAKFKKAGYRKGVFNLNKNELAWTQEDNKPEIIVRKSDGAILTPLSKGDSVLNNNATSNIWDMANDPTKFIKDNLSSNLDISNGNNNISNNTVQNDINMNITLPNVKNYNEFVNQLQKDSKFERMIQDMTVNQLSGKSSLNKFRYKFK